MDNGFRLPKIFNGLFVDKYLNIQTSDNCAEIAPVLITLQKTNKFKPVYSLDVSQCSSETKHRILFNKIDSSEFD